MTASTIKAIALLAFAAFALIIYGTNAQAAPTLMADAYSATGPQPTSAEWSSDGSTWRACTITARVPSCDLANIGAAGSYTLRMRYVYTAGCLGEVCWAAGAASSAPFAFVWQAVPAQAPAGLALKP